MLRSDRRASKSYGERLAQLGLVCAWTGIALVAVWLGLRAASGDLPFSTRVDPRTGTAGLLVETDAETGCEYIVTPWGGIVPRMGADGKQRCVAKP